MTNRINHPPMKGLIALRKSRGLSQRALSIELGCSLAIVAQWERGYCLPSVQNLLELARFFGCTTDEILSHRPSEQAS